MDLTRSRKELLAENAFLRQQLIAALRMVKRPAFRPRERGQRWHTFLRNHTVWACDFLQTYDIWFRTIFAFFSIDINTSEMISDGRYFNTMRPHQGLGQRMPASTPRQIPSILLHRQHQHAPSSLQHLQARR